MNFRHTMSFQVSTVVEIDIIAPEGQQQAIQMAVGVLEQDFPGSRLTCLSYTQGQVCPDIVLKEN